MKLNPVGKKSELTKILCSCPTKIFCIYMAGGFLQQICTVEWNGRFISAHAYTNIILLSNNRLTII